MPADSDAIRNWLKLLAALNVGSISTKELQLRFAALGPALAAEFASYAFSEASARHVAAECTHFPVFGEIVPLLRAWCREHPPPPRPAIATEQPATVKQREIEREVAESWRTITSAQVNAKIRAIRDGWQPGMMGTFLASALRKHAPQHLGLLPPEWLKEPPHRDAA